MDLNDCSIKILVTMIIMVSFEGNHTVKADVGKGVVTIAFDDGNQNQYDYAFPLLNEYGMPATFYIITSDISDFSGDNSYMSIAEFRIFRATVAK